MNFTFMEKNYLDLYVFKKTYTKKLKWNLAINKNLKFIKKKKKTKQFNLICKTNTYLNSCLFEIGFFSWKFKKLTLEFSLNLLLNTIKRYNSLLNYTLINIPSIWLLFYKQNFKVLKKNNTYIRKNFTQILHLV